MYSLVNITASDQFTPNNSIWKPVDGEHAPLDEVSWRSLSSSKSWWRMEFPHRSRISGVVIYPPGSTKGDKMNGFAVYVGDSPVGNGSKNAMCGKPWRETVTSVITIRCRTLPVGKYLYVSAADRPGATVFLSEISFFTCQGNYMSLYGKCCRLHSIAFRAKCCDHGETDSTVRCLSHMPRH